MERPFCNGGWLVGVWVEVEGGWGGCRRLYYELGTVKLVFSLFVACLVLGASWRNFHSLEFVAEGGFSTF